MCAQGILKLDPNWNQDETRYPASHRISDGRHRGHRWALGWNRLEHCSPRRLDPRVGFQAQGDPTVLQPAQFHYQPVTMGHGLDIPVITL